MGPAEKERLVKHFHRDAPGIFPAVLSCAAGLAALVMVAVSPWLLLTSSPAGFASAPPAVQAALKTPAVEESKRVFDERRQRFQAGRQGGDTQAVENRVAAGQ